MMKNRVYTSEYVGYQPIGPDVFKTATITIGDKKYESMIHACQMLICYNKYDEIVSISARIKVLSENLNTQKCCLEEIGIELPQNLFDQRVELKQSLKFTNFIPDEEFDFSILDYRDFPMSENEGIKNAGCYVPPVDLPDSLVMNCIHAKEIENGREKYHMFSMHKNIRTIRSG